MAIETTYIETEIAERKNRHAVFTPSLVTTSKSKSLDLEKESMQSPSTFGQLTRVTEVEVKNYGWHKIINMQGRVISVIGEEVVCECLIDSSELIFETRSFPKMLFMKIQKLMEKPFVYITIRSRPGTTRLDVEDGSKLVDKKLFEQKDVWDDPDFRTISTPLTKQIRYD